MPETTFLQIQGRDESASRVLELPIGPVRIGRGSFCEVRLGDEPGLGDVQCLLRRRGTNWHFQPVGPPGHVWIDGRPADHQRPLPIGSSLRVGDHWLTLRSAANPPEARGSFTAPIAVEPRTFDEPTPASAPVAAAEPIPPEDGGDGDFEPPRTATATAEDEDRLRRWQARLEQRERWLKNRQDERAWEARWKAAGETIRGRATPPPVPPSRPGTPPPASPSRPATPPPAPSSRPATPRPLGTTPSPTAAPPAPSAERRFPARPAERIVEPRAAAPLHRPAEPARRPVPPRVPVRPATPPAPTPPRPRPEPVAPTSRALATTPATLLANEPEVAPLPGVEIPTPPEPTVAPAELVVAEPMPLPAEVVAIETPTVIDPAVDAIGEVSTQAPAEAVADLESPPVEAIGIVEPAALPFEAESEALPAEAEESATVEDATVAEERPAPEPDLPAVVPIADPAEVAFPARPPVREPGTRGAEWPSARTIFEARGTRPIPGREAAPASKRRVKPGPMPTAVMAPAQWTMPLWLGWLPTTMAALAAGLVGLFLAWSWTVDAMAMNEAVALALRPERSAPPTIHPSKIPHAPWWQTSPAQTAAWAVAVERSADAEDRGDEVRSLFDSARQAAPLAGTARFVVEWPASPEPDAPPAPVAIGRSRDVVSLAWTGRNFRQVGKIDLAIRAYRSAFEIAAHSGSVAAEPPAFDESRQPRRFLLPHEGLLEWVARDMAEAGDWSPEQWDEAIPAFAVARLAAARAAQDRGDRDQADRLVDRIVADIEAPTPPGVAEAEHRAAGAEALALRARWADASDLYRRAIDEAGDDATRRMWWVNLAEVAGRSGDESARTSALEQASALAPDDEITKRALKSQDLAGLGRTANRP